MQRMLTISGNKRDYMEQMALWLQRQEAVILRRTYLAWLHPEESDNASKEYDSGDDEEDDLVQVEQPSHVPFLIPTLPSTTYRIAKHPSISNVTVGYLETIHGANDFLQALTVFLAKASPRSPTPSKYDRFDVFKQISLSIPFNSYLALNQSTVN